MKATEQYQTEARFSEVPASNFSGPESCFMFSVFAFKIKVSIILQKGKMELSVNDAALTGSWAENCAAIKQREILI